MSEPNAVGAGDRPPFEESWYDVRGLSRFMPIEDIVVQNLARLTDLSEQAVDELGESYRGYKVGTAFLVLNEAEGRMGIYFAGNFTPHQGADWNCAEKRALEKVIEKGYDRILAIALAGPSQPDDYDGCAHRPFTRVIAACQCLVTRR